MNNDINTILINILNQYKNNELNQEEILSKIKEIYFEDIGFAKIDHHRELRRGFPEVIFGANKTPKQILEIAKRILKYSSTLLVTKTTKECFDFLRSELENVGESKNIAFNPLAGVIYTIPPKDHDKDLKKGIIVICAGTSDIPVAEESAITAYLMGNDVEKIFDVGVAGIHRLLNYKNEILAANVIVAIAGMEGALPGIVSSISKCPVIGVPTSVGYGMNLKGLSSLLTMLNSCSPGLSVVNIDNGFGAGYIAGLINKKICFK